MHIAMWSPGWPLDKFQNGIITYVHWMKLELESQGHRVSVFTSEFDQATRAPGIHVVKYGLMERAIRRVSMREVPWERQVFDFSRLIAAEILRVHRHEPIDVVEMEESFGWFADVRQLTALPVLVKLHGPAFLSLVENERNTPFGQEKINREGQALKRARAITSPSDLLLAQTIERYRLAPRETRCIVNPLTMDGDAPIWRLGDCDPRMILFVGRFDLRKGADLILQAFLSMLRTQPDLKLTFVGPDRGIPAIDGTLIHIKAYCESLFPASLRNQIEFRGIVANHEIAKLRAQARVTVIASRWESQGYTALEAMLQGCPVVSTDAGALPESVVNGVTGLLARSEDVADLASKILIMIGDPNGSIAMGRAARQHVISNHSPRKVASATAAMYEKVIAGESRGD